MIRSVSYYHDKYHLKWPPLFEKALIVIWNPKWLIGLSRERRLLPAQEFNLNLSFPFHPQLDCSQPLSLFVPPALNDIFKVKKGKFKHSFHKNENWEKVIKETKNWQKAKHATTKKRTKTKTAPTIKTWNLSFATIPGSYQWISDFAKQIIPFLLHNFNIGNIGNVWISESSLHFSPGVIGWQCTESSLCSKFKSFW